MFEDLAEQRADAILALMALFRDDPRPGKIDLGVGVYRDETGHTPVMTAVAAAERQLLCEQRTKTYVALAGDPRFAIAMAGLVLGADFPGEGWAAAATPGGTGAIRQALELVAMAAPNARIWVPSPTWPNHLSILAHLRRPIRSYRYYDAGRGTVDFDGMCTDLEKLAPGDVVLLHGCCHNPTGADLDIRQWRSCAELLDRRGAVPLVDLAYQGLGTGLDADAAGLRHLARHLPETLIAASCSKNFGLYRERAGILIATASGMALRRVEGAMVHLNRQNYSFPPDHGARLATMILEDARLRQSWEAELSGMRERVAALRMALAAELRARTGGDRFDFIARQQGMFSRLGLGHAEVARLRNDHAVYMVGDGRMNLAGLRHDSIPRLAEAVAGVL